MAVYVDDASVPAEVRNGRRVHRSAWSRLTADTTEELHEFASRLGLRREWFQPGRPIGGWPSPVWHDDVTSGKLAQALAMGAAGVSPRELALYCRARDGRAAQPSGGMRSGRDEGANAPRRRAAPEKPCPDCGTAELTHGREVCQARGLLRILAAREAQPSSRPVSPQLEAGS
jgi:hypothetical protein